MPVHPLAAQEQAGDSDHSIRGVLRNGALLSLHALTSACPPFVARAPKVSEMYVPEDKPLRAWCAVDSTYALPHADGRRWMAAVYGSRLEYEPNDEQKKYLLTPRDTDVFVTAVLYSAESAPPRPQAASRWRAEWMTTVAQRLVYNAYPELVGRSDGSALVAIRFCINGTGGCWQEYLHRVHGRWTKVEEAWRAQLPQFSEGVVGKGAGITLQTLSGSYGVYGPGDGNCCPSHELLVALTLRRDSLGLKSWRVQKSEP